MAWIYGGIYNCQINNLHALKKQTVLQRNRVRSFPIIAMLISRCLSRVQLYPSPLPQHLLSIPRCFHY
jgi:hypothetical protein